MQNSGPYALSPSTLLQVADPSSTFGTSSAAVQIQNASPFILIVSVAGQQQSIQSFTAQTLALTGDATPITIVPGSTPAGTQGSLTVVWLQPGESSPMNDGQLTAAAQYAVGLGQILLGPLAVASSGSFPVTLPPTARTLLLRMIGIIHDTITSVAVIGTDSGIGYRGVGLANAPAPYLQGQSALLKPLALCVVPVSALLDPDLTVLITTALSGDVIITVAVDTAQYDESVFYNGTVKAVAVGVNFPAAAATVLTGPARLLTASLAFAGSPSAAGISINGNQQLGMYGSADAQSNTLTFPPNTILEAGVPVAVAVAGAGSATASLAYAYP